MRNLLLSTLCGALLLSGCTMTKHSPVTDEPITATMAQNLNRAVLTLYRDQELGAALPAPIALYKADQSGYEFLGIVSFDTYTVATLEPGEYLLVSGNLGEGFARIQVAAHRVYTVEIVLAPQDSRHDFDFVKADLNEALMGELKSFDRVRPGNPKDLHQGELMMRKAKTIQAELAKDEKDGKDLPPLVLTPEDGLTFEAFQALFDKTPAKAR